MSIRVYVRVLLQERAPTWTSCCRYVRRRRYSNSRWQLLVITRTARHDRTSDMAHRNNRDRYADYTKVTGNCIAVTEHRVTATECHLPYGITQCYLLPDTSDRTPPSPQPVRPGPRFTYPGGIEGWVDLGDLLHTEMVYPPGGGHPSKY